MMRPKILPPEVPWTGDPSTEHPDPRPDMEFWVPYIWPKHIHCSFDYTGNCDDDRDTIVTRHEHRKSSLGWLNVRCRAHQDLWARFG